MANKYHLQMLREGTYTWDNWRQKYPSIIPDFTEADLIGADLRRANLVGANFAEAKLNSVNFANAKLQQANFARAN